MIILQIFFSVVSMYYIYIYQDAKKLSETTPATERCVP